MKSSIPLVAVATLLTAEVNADNLKDLVRNGSVSGNVRAYYNTRDYPEKTDEAGFALGGALRAESGSLGLFNFGLGYYTAQDLGLNSDDPAEVNKRLGEDLEVLAEAYGKLTFSNATFSAGRQKFNTPFANPGDAFIIPFTFNGYSLESKPLESLTLKADYFTSIKNRNSDTFVNVGEWSTARYGVDVTGTSGTLNLGALYKAGGADAEIWFTDNAQLFRTLYLKAGYQFSGDSIKPFVGFQYAGQQETGDALLGTVDSSLLGLQAGAAAGQAKFTLGYNSVAESQDAFKNGAFLSPYTFSTSPLFTNNMLQTVENVDAGNAIKGTFNYAFGNSVKLKLSYATFDFNNTADRDAVDVDITYNFSGFYQGLSLRWRLEVVTSDVSSVEQTNNRFQLQFVF